MNVLWFVGHILNATIIVLNILFLLIGFGSLGFGLPEKYEDCPAQVWCFLFGSNVVLFVFSVVTRLFLCKDAKDIDFIVGDTVIAIFICAIEAYFVFCLCVYFNSTFNGNKCPDGAVEVFTLLINLIYIFIAVVAFYIGFGELCLAVDEKENKQKVDPLKESLI
jgi:hypothetical protein